MKRITTLFMRKALFSIILVGMAFLATNVWAQSSGHGAPSFSCAVNDTYTDVDSGLVWQCGPTANTWKPNPQYLPWVTPTSGNCPVGNGVTFVSGPCGANTSTASALSPASAAAQIGYIANSNLALNSVQLFSDGTQSYCAGPAYCSNGTYIDDTALAAMSNPSAFPAANLLNIVNKFIANKNGNGEFPIAIGTNGASPIYYSAWDLHHAYATGDGWIMVPQLLYLYCQDVGLTSTACTSAYTTNVAAIKTALARPPRSGTGLITVVTGNEYIAGMAFMEYMRNTGDVANANVWYAVICQKMAAMATAAGDTTNAAFFNAQYASTVAAIKANLIDGTTGMLITASDQNSTNLDVVSSVLADYYGLLTTAQNTAIETYVSTNYASLVNASGFIRESPTAWATIGYIPAGGGAPYTASPYTSTQYQGGYWSFHFGWFAYCLNKANTTSGPGKVKTLLQAYLSATPTDPNTEWYNVGSTAAQGTTPNLESPQGPYWAAVQYPLWTAPSNTYLATTSAGGGDAAPGGAYAAATLSVPYQITYSGGSNNTLLNYTSSSTANTATFVENTSAGGHKWADLILGSLNSAVGNRCWLDSTTGYISFCVLTTSTVTAFRFPSSGFIQWNTTNSASGNAVDVGLSRTAAKVLSVDDGTASDSNGSLKAASIISGGTKFTASGCSNTTTVGGASAGSFVAGATSCAVVITPGVTAPNGWICKANDLTTNADTVNQTASTTTTATLSGTVAVSDVINFGCSAY